MSSNDQTHHEWESPFSLDQTQLSAFQDHGVAKIKDFFSAESIETLRQEVIQVVNQLGSSVDNDQPNAPA
ncbi:MAG: hypothetical protein ABGX16_12645 [Pirellulales bacterium]